jgi:hypothetical protein
MTRQLLIVVLSFGVCAAPALAQEADQNAQASVAPATTTQLPPAQLPPSLGENKLKTSADWIQNRFGSGKSKEGFYPEFGNLPPGSGISAGPGFRHDVFGGAVVDASAVVGWSLSTAGQAQLKWPQLAGRHLNVGVEAEWQDFKRITFFGIGQTSLEADRSDFRLQNMDYSGFASVTAHDWLTFGGSVGYLPRATIERPVHTIDPATQDLFTEATAPGLFDHPALLHSDAFINVDTRDHPARPSTGGDYRVTFSDFSDRDLDRFSFRRVEAEASQYFPILRDNWVIALRARVAGSDTSNNNEVPFYLLPTLGSSRTLRGYDDYRFRDRNLLLLNAEYRWTVFGALDGALFYDAGKVTPRFGDLDLSHLKTSYGVGLRFHSDQTTFVRLDVGHSTEGTRLIFSFSESLTPGHRSILVPYVP